MMLRGIIINYFLKPNEECPWNDYRSISKRGRNNQAFYERKRKLKKFEIVRKMSFVPEEP